ncbi:two-component system response regulator KdpE [Methylotenera sp.]|uniref:two-component system response regulator KdpE n=1 Tax=Methylotenera sp. TaxID=2051956 RepID=UPI0025DAA86D|nr:two-component system response regulator KdpE [uncultured Methylotenera sp.]
MNSKNVVIVEDEPQIRHFVKEALEAEGWVVFEAENGKRGLIESGCRKPDLLIVDLGLPDIDGVNVIQEFRNWSTVPILILSARTEEATKIIALDAGADDYLTKPFGIGELLARVRAVTRRRFQAADMPAIVSFGSVEIDLSQHSVHREGQVVHLTPIEYRLLVILLSNPSKILSQSRLMKEVWGPNHTESSHYLRIYMSHLRRKLENDPAQPEHLLTEIGVGYRFEP